MVISGGSYQPDVLKSSEVVSMLLDVAEIEAKSTLWFASKNHYFINIPTIDLIANCWRFSHSTQCGRSRMRRRSLRRGEKRSELTARKERTRIRNNSQSTRRHHRPALLSIRQFPLHRSQPDQFSPPRWQSRTRRLCEMWMNYHVDWSWFGGWERGNVIAGPRLR